MTISEAHTTWGRKSEHLITYNRTKALFERGFQVLDFDKATSYYSKKEFAAALAYSDLKEEEKSIAASVMCHVLYFVRDAYPNQQGAIDFIPADLLNYTPVAPVTDPAEPTSVLWARKTSTIGAVTEKSETSKPKVTITVNKEKNNLGKKPKSILQIDPETGNVINTYNSISEAERELGIKNIRRAIDRDGTAGGYCWKDANLGNKGSSAKSSAKPESSSEKEIVNKPLLTNISDQELIAEMRRRCWKGNIDIVTRVEL